LLKIIDLLIILYAIDVFLVQFFLDRMPHDETSVREGHTTSNSANLTFFRQSKKFISKKPQKY